MFPAHNDTHEKFYFLSRTMRAKWTNTRAICKSYNMDVLSLDCEAETEHFRNLCKINHKKLDQFTLLGGMNLVPKSKEHWYWVNSGEQIDHRIKFSIGEPNFNYDDELCLAIVKFSAGLLFLFNDVPCNYKCYDYLSTDLCRFLCQKIGLIGIK